MSAYFGNAELDNFVGQFIFQNLILNTEKSYH